MRIWHAAVRFIFQVHQQSNLALLFLLWVLRVLLLPLLPKAIKLYFSSSSLSSRDVFRLIRISLKNHINVVVIWRKERRRIFALWAGRRKNFIVVSHLCTHAWICTHSHISGKNVRESPHKNVLSFLTYALRSQCAQQRCCNSSVKP